MGVSCGVGTCPHSMNNPLYPLHVLVTCKAQNKYYIMWTFINSINLNPLLGPHTQRCCCSHILISQPNPLYYKLQSYNP